MREKIAVAAWVALLLVTLCLPTIRGDGSGAVPEATAFTTQRKLVRFSDGVLALAYVLQVNGTNRVQVARSANGLQWSPLDPPSLGGPTADRPALAVDSRDALHLAWTANDTYGRQVFYSSYANGRWSSAERVSETPRYSGFPSIAIDSRDRVHVAWYGFDGTYYQVYYRARTATGWAPQVAVTAESVDATNPALSVDGNDGLHVVWYHLDGRGIGFQVSYARVMSGPIAVETISGAQDAVDPTMVVDRSGRVLVAWTSSGVPSHIATARREGTVWSDPLIATPSSLGASHPSLALDDAQNPFLFFQGDDGQIYLERETNGSWLAPVSVTTQSGNSFPSARWSYYPVRPPAGPTTVDVVWTESTASGHAVRFAGVNGTAASGTPPDSTMVSDLVFFGGLLAAVAGIVLLRRRRRRIL
jgi:MYXO-CTERM domain-containing protein